MSLLSSDIFLVLPKEIIHHILSYSDAVKWRNGKYMNQIPKNDNLYVLLKKIPKPPIFNDNIYCGFYVTINSVPGGRNRMLCLSYNYASREVKYRYDGLIHDEVYYYMILKLL